ncbi:hypothetical protein [Pseudoalteromonas sp. NJ631]|uniref:hypothetical protein n=1 Tax=Pseudoalteromonas sp. NJ631 TaxID=493915 RepID=UPI000301B412|nr:hypothetical protein [Pseudoalteromonas sp. NJ631]
MQYQTKRIIGSIFLSTFAGIAIFTAVAHLSCIYLGASCYRAQLAPADIIDSAIAGTWYAPTATVFISALFLTTAAYALSVLKWIKPLPMLRPAIFTISTLCLVRGAITLPLAIVFPEKTTSFAIVAGGIWFLAGVFCLVGFKFIKNQEKDKQ